VTDEEDLSERVNSITGSEGARIIFDPIGGRALETLAAAASTSGIIFEYGIMAEDPTPYPLHLALKKHLTTKAYTLFEVVSNPNEYPDEFRKAKEYIFNGLIRGDFKPTISRTFRLSDIVEAHR